MLLGDEDCEWSGRQAQRSHLLASAGVDLQDERQVAADVDVTELVPDEGPEAQLGVLVAILDDS